MNIRQIITLKYKDLSILCKKNYINSIENTKGLKDIEDVDILHTLCIRWIKKYEYENFVDADEIYKKIRNEFIGEKNKFTKLNKPEQKRFISISEYNIDF